MKNFTFGSGMDGWLVMFLVAVLAVVIPYPFVIEKSVRSAVGRWKGWVGVQYGARLVILHTRVFGND